jgi:hypothetical protein
MANDGLTASRMKRGCAVVAMLVCLLWHNEMLPVAHKTFFEHRRPGGARKLEIGQYGIN